MAVGYSAIHSFAQFSSEITITDNMDDPSCVFISDIDGDGNLDVLAGSFSDNKVLWYKSIAPGEYSTQHLISTAANGVRSVFAMDLDLDGDMDVLSASETDNTIAWYENLGDGNFGERLILSDVFALASRVYAADMDGDGDADIIAAAYGDDKIVWFENMGGGTFGAMTIISDVANGARDVYAADLDGDGDLDVISASEIDDKIAWYENDGGGAFSAEIIISIAANGANAITASDADGDGDLDVFSTSKTDNKIAWYENSGAGVFGSEHVISTAVSDARGIKISDLNGDGLLDVLTSARGDNEVDWFQNLGGGAYSAKIIISDDADLVNSVTAGDIDDDGDMDVFSTSETRDKLVVYENLGSGVFDAEYIISTFVQNGSAIKCVDIDADGDADILYTSNGLYLDSRKAGWFENLGLGMFSKEKVLVDLNPRSPGNIESGDIDGDGDLDMVITIPSGVGAHIAWFENYGDTLFSEINYIDELDLIASIIRLSDYDNDGDLDFIIGHHTKVAICENSGGGVFLPHIYLNESGLSSINSVECADLDGDGNEDILISQNTEVVDQIAWFRNLGDGSFAPFTYIPCEGDAMYCAYAYDIDLDGDFDIVSGSYNDGIVSWYENDGTGNFAAQTVISALENGVNAMSFSDIDGDSRNDLVVGSGAGASWYRNISTGEYGEKQIVTQVPSYTMGQSANTEDFDLDGDIDILTSSFFYKAIFWQKNQLVYPIQIKGNLYIDLNLNGELDDTDIAMSEIGVVSDPVSDFTYTYPEGDYFMNFSDELGTYIIQPQELEHWSIFSDSLSYHITVDSVYLAMDSLNFGFTPDTAINDIEPLLVDAYPRCNDTINYWINIENKGTTIPSGLIHLQLDDSVAYITSAIEPDSVNGQHVYWHYDSLLYFSDYLLNLNVRMPSFLSMDDTLISSVEINVIDTMGLEALVTIDSLIHPLVCGYDPNDKIVSPRGRDSLGYISKTTASLEYTIRFQNTGTDTAFTILIKDFLDPNLDWNSLDPMASSHPMTVNVNHTGEITFSFIDIMLPDSNVNFLGSQGFVTYQINLVEGLPAGTQIKNKARIYFDANPPVITNTTINTLECIAIPVFIDPIQADTICPESEVIKLTASNSGGVYSGSGIEVDTFNPAKAGIGNHLITYSLIDSMGCEAKDSIAINVVSCPNNDLDGAAVKTYPNPARDFATIYFGSAIKQGRYVLQLFNLAGELVYEDSGISGESAVIKLTNFSTGSYYLQIVEGETKTRIYHKSLIVF